MSDLLRFPRLLVLMMLAAFSSVISVSFTPAFPLLVQEFQLGDSEVQWMMTIFLFGSVVGRLPYGPLANAIGRKRTLYVGLWISLVGTLMAVFAPSYLILCLGRWVQALGSAAGMTIAYTMIGDCHAGVKATKALSYVMVAFAILPGIGATVGGFLTESMGWRGSFFFLLFFTLLLILVSFTLPETGKGRDLNELRVHRILNAYRRGFKDRSLVFHGLMMGMSTALLFIFSQQAPFVGIDFMGLTPAEYGVYYFLPACGIAIGSYLTALFAGVIEARKAMILGILIMFIGVLSMAFFFLNGWYAGWTLFLPQVVVQLGDAFLYANASSEAISESSDKANASTIVLFLNGVCAAVGTFVVGIYAPKTPIALPAIFLLLIALMLAMWLLLGRHRRSTKKA